MLARPSASTRTRLAHPGVGRQRRWRTATDELPDAEQTYSNRLGTRRRTGTAGLSVCRSPPYRRRRGRRSFARVSPGRRRRPKNQIDRAECRPAADA
jgi:hypothetical protein